jgi:hypothetical protein
VTSAAIPRSEVLGSVASVRTARGCAAARADAAGLHEARHHDLGVPMRL